MTAPVTTRVLINTTGRGILLSGEAEQWLREHGYERQSRESTGRRHDDGGWENSLPEGVRASDDGNADGNADDEDFSVGPSRMATDEERLALSVLRLRAALWAWCDSRRHERPHGT